MIQITQNSHRSNTQNTLFKILQSLSLTISKQFITNSYQITIIIFTHNNHIQQQEQIDLHLYKSYTYQNIPLQSLIINQLQSNIMESTKPPSELQISRQKFTTEARKNNRIQDISHRRSMNLNIDKKQIPTGDPTILDLESKVKTFLSKNYDKINIKEYIEKFKSEDILLIHQGIIGIRKYVSSNDAQSELVDRIQIIIDANVVIKILEYMRQSKFPRLQIECSWTITNLVSGNSYQCQSVINKGAIPIIIGLLDADDPDLIEQIVWGIGNISSDSIMCRDLLLQNQVIPKLVHVLNTQQRYQTIKQVAWSLSNLCRRVPSPKKEYLSEIAPYIYSFVAQDRTQDLSVINDLCWSMVVLTDQSYGLLEQFFSRGAFKKVVEIFQQLPDDKSFLAPILSIFGNVASGSDSEVAELLKIKDLVFMIEQKLGKSQKNVRQQAMRVFQYLASGTQDQIAQILSSSTLLPRIVEAFNQQQQIQILAITTIQNFCFTNSVQLAEIYYQLGVYGKIVKFLKSTKVRILMASLQCVFAMLSMGEQISGLQNPNMIKKQLEKEGLIDELERLQLFKSNNVYNTNLKILDRFYEAQ